MFSSDTFADATHKPPSYHVAEAPPSSSLHCAVPTRQIIMENTQICFTIWSVLSNFDNPDVSSAAEGAHRPGEKAGAWKAEVD